MQLKYLPMKYKILFLLLAELLLESTITASSFNKEQLADTVIFINEKTWENERTHSVPFKLVVTKEENIFRVYSNINLPELEICVTDVLGHIVYAEIISTSNHRPFSFQLLLTEMEEDEYMIELSYNKKYFCEYFSR